MRVDLAHAGQIIVAGALDRRIKILADADAANPRIAAACKLCDEMIDAFVVEAHAVDEAMDRTQPEEARLRVAWLRSRRHGAEFDVAEAERPERIQIVAVLVKT